MRVPLVKPPPRGLRRRRVAARLAITVGMAIPAASLAGARVVGHAWITKVLAVATLVAVAGGVTHVATRRPAAHRTRRASRSGDSRPRGKRRACWSSAVEAPATSS